MNLKICYKTAVTSRMYKITVFNEALHITLYSEENENNFIYLKRQNLVF